MFHDSEYSDCCTVTLIIFGHVTCPEYFKCADQCLNHGACGTIGIHAYNMLEQHITHKKIRMFNNPAVKDSYWAILPNIFADIAIELGT